MRTSLSTIPCPGATGLHAPSIGANSARPLDRRAGTPPRRGPLGPGGDQDCAGTGCHVGALLAGADPLLHHWSCPHFGAPARYFAVAQLTCLSETPLGTQSRWRRSRPIARMGISASGEDSITAKRAKGGCSLGVPVLYIILGLDRRANEDDIHSSYHRLAAAHRSGGIQDRALASRRLRVLAEAYAVLGDPARRALYDAQLSTVARQPVQPASALPDTRGAPEIAPTAAPSPPEANLPAQTERPHRHSMRAAIVATLLALATVGLAERARNPRVAPPSAHTAASASVGRPAAETIPGPRSIAAVTWSVRPPGQPMAGAAADNQPAHAEARSVRSSSITRPTAPQRPQTGAVRRPRRGVAAALRIGPGMLAQQTGRTQEVRLHVVASRSDARHPHVAQIRPAADDSPARRTPRHERPRVVLHAPPPHGGHHVRDERGPQQAHRRIWSAKAPHRRHRKVLWGTVRHAHFLFSRGWIVVAAHWGERPERHTLARRLPYIGRAVRAGAAQHYIHVCGCRIG